MVLLVIEQKNSKKERIKTTKKNWKQTEKK